MKKTYKLFLFVLIVSLLALNTMLVPSAQTESRFGRQILSGMLNSSALLTTYDELKEGFENAADKISLSADIKEDDLATVVSALINDYPEFFWVTGGYSYSQSGSSKNVTSVEPNYLFPRSKIAAAASSLDAMASKMLEGLEGKSDYDKALLIHDRLADRVTYKSTDNDQTAYGAIVEGEAVCAGYARAYHYLLGKAGIDAWSIEGESINPASNTREGHRWNMVKLDGRWYYSDVTWDDQPGTIYHNYFNRTLTYFNKTHFPSQFKNYLPDDNSTALDYFAKNDLVFKTVDADRIVKLLKKSDNIANIYVDGDVKSFLDSLGKKMGDIVTSLGAKGGASYTYSSSSLGNEIFLTVIIEQKGHTHSPKKVKGSPATCYQTGTKDYYKCSCGRAFTDKNGKNELESAEDLVIDKLEHTASDEWRSNDTAHWKYCTVCDADIEGSTSLHTDEDENLVCDVCSAESGAPFVQDEGNGTSDEGKDFPWSYPAIAAAIVLGIISLLVKLFKR